MALVFVGIDPDTGGDNCPAVFIEEETGDFQRPAWHHPVLCEPAGHVDARGVHRVR
jgi:hypothetical protein